MNDNQLQVKMFMVASLLRPNKLENWKLRWEENKRPKQSKGELGKNLSFNFTMQRNHRQLCL